ncbi:hypothetical protein M5689_001165 [Euphorbia peplus]|nr:hypothetical protein M5689_001165 [Euphorbia peplus]
MVNSSGFIIGLFLLTLSLSSIDVGLASRKLFQYKPPSNGLEGLKKTLNDVQKLVNSNSATKPSEADLKQIQSLLKQIHDLIPKTGTTATKGTPSTPRFSRRLFSVNPLSDMENSSRKRNLQNIDPVVHPSGLPQPKNPPQQKTRKLFQLVIPDNGTKPQPKLPNMPHVHLQNHAGGSRRLSQLPTTLPNPFASMARSPSSLPKFPPFPQFPRLNFPRRGALPPLPNLRTRSFQWRSPNSHSTGFGFSSTFGTKPTPKTPGAHTTNPSASTTGATQPVNQASGNVVGAQSTDPSTTQASQSADQVPGNTAGPQTMQSSQPMDQASGITGIPSRRLFESTISKSGGGSRKLLQLPTTLPNPSVGMAKPPTSLPKLPRFPQRPRFNFRMPGALPPLPNMRARSFPWRLPNSRSARGGSPSTIGTSTSKTSGAQTTNPSTSTTGASQPMNQALGNAAGAQSTNPSVTQASQPMNQASASTGMPSRRLSASTIPNTPNKMGNNGMPERIMARATLQGILNHGSNRLGYTEIPKYSR